MGETGGGHITTSGGAKQYHFEKVKEFVYLGTTITATFNQEAEIQARIQCGNKSASALHKVLTSNHLSNNAKLRVYKTVIRPAVLYASETWTLTQKLQNMLCTWERKIVRRILGGIQENGTWRRRTNREVLDSLKGKDIAGAVKSQRIRWLGHVQRMPDSRTPKKMMYARLLDTRRQGRPKIKWIEQVKDDLRKLQVKRWWQKVRNREEWRKITYQATGLNGL